MSILAGFGANFPGVVYDGNGRPKDSRRTPLSVEILRSYPHRGLVRRANLVPAQFQVWVLENWAAIEDVALEAQEFALGFVLEGGGILLLADFWEPVRNVREGLLTVLAVNAALVSQRAMHEAAA